MPRRDGVNRRQVPQLRRMLKAGRPVSEISGEFNVEHQVVFNFAKGWGIKLKETPESIALHAHDELIEGEVSRRLAERTALGAKPVTMEMKPVKGNKR